MPGGITGFVFISVWMCTEQDLYPIGLGRLYIYYTNYNYHSNNPRDPGSPPEMVSWNLKNMHFGGDGTSLAHHLRI